MGIRSWPAWSLLVVLLFAFNVDAAVRVQSSATVKQSRQSVIDGGTTENPAGFQTPNGSAAYFGQEHVDYHTAGNRFKAGDSPGTQTPPPKSVKVKPVALANKAKLAAKAVAIARASAVGLATMAASEAMIWAIDQLPGASFDPATGQPVKAPEVLTEGHFWSARHYGGNSPKNALNPTDACSQLYISGMTAVKKDDWTYTCYRYTTQDVGSASRINFSCPNGLNTSTWQCHTTAAPSQPFTETDYAALTAALASVQNSEWLRDLMRRSCEGASSVSACYEDLTEWGSLLGPASQTDNPVTKTSTTTFPDGTTSTTATTTQNTYNYKYGPTYFDFSTTTTTSTNTDGDVTTTTTTDQQPETETPAETEEQPKEEEQEQDYQFSDTDLPDVDPFYEQQYPDGLSGVWNTRKAELDNSPFLQFLQSFVPSFSGTCPSFGLDFNIGQWLSAGHIDFMSLCFVFDFIKVVLLVSAVFLARAITFGG